MKTFSPSLDFRGNALPETALVMALILMMLYGAVQTALLGYTQLSADGAAFVAAHTTVAKYGNPNVSANSAIKTYAQGVANSVFDRINKTDVTAVTNPNCYTFETQVVKTVPGFINIGGPKAFTVSGREIEPQTATCASDQDLVGFSNVPPLPHESGTGACGSLATALNGSGKNLSDALTTATTTSNNLTKALGDIDGLLNLLGPLLTTSNGTSPLLTSISGAVSSVLNTLLPPIYGVANPLVATITNTLLSGTNPLGTLVENELQTVVNEALNGTTPTASQIAADLTTGITSLLGVLNLGSLLTPIVSGIANAITATIFTPLLTPLQQIAGDHSIVSGLINGPCN